MGNNATGDSGIGRQNDDLRPGGASAGISRQDSNVGTRQAIEGTSDDDLAAGSEREMLREAARSTPPMGDVRSDAIPGAHDAGEPR